MVWTIEITATAEKALSKMDKTSAKRILVFLKKRAAEDPRTRGKKLSGNLGDFWSYRVGNYRIICDIQDKISCLLVIKVGHRRNVYEKR